MPDGCVEPRKTMRSLVRVAQSDLETEWLRVGWGSDKNPILSQPAEDNGVTDGSGSEFDGEVIRITQISQPAEDNGVTDGRGSELVGEVIRITYFPSPQNTMR